MRSVHAYAAALLIGAAIFLQPSPADAQGATTAICTVTVHAHFSGGISLMPSTGQETTTSGVISCTGTVSGRRVTGPGTFGYTGRYTQISCLTDAHPLTGSF